MVSSVFKNFISNNELKYLINCDSYYRSSIDTVIPPPLIKQNKRNTFLVIGGCKKKILKSTVLSEL